MQHFQEIAKEKYQNNNKYLLDVKIFILEKDSKLKTIPVSNLDNFSL